MPEPFDRLAKAPPEPDADSAELLRARMKQTGKIELGDVRLTDLSAAPPRKRGLPLAWLVVGVMALGVALLMWLVVLPLHARLAETQSELAAVRENAAALRARVEELSAHSADLESAQKTLTSEVEQTASEREALIRAAEERAAEERRKLAEKSKNTRKKK